MLSVKEVDIDVLGIPGVAEDFLQYLRSDAVKRNLRDSEVLLGSRHDKSPISLIAE
jgi:hypothetical protein